MTQGSADEGRSGAGATITPLDIQQKEFRVSRFGGYRMRDVDEFLDRLTEVVTGLTAENARLRRQAAAGPVAGGRTAAAPAGRGPTERARRRRRRGRGGRGHAEPSRHRGTREARADPTGLGLGRRAWRRGRPIVA